MRICTTLYLLKCVVSSLNTFRWIIVNVFVTEFKGMFLPHKRYKMACLFLIMYQFWTFPMGTILSLGVQTCSFRGTDRKAQKCTIRWTIKVQCRYPGRRHLFVFVLLCADCWYESHVIKKGVCFNRIPAVPHILRIHTHWHAMARSSAPECHILRCSEPFTSHRAPLTSEITYI